MIDFTNITKAELETNGLFFATEKEAALFGAVIVEEYEVRIGKAIAAKVGSEKIKEFETASSESAAVEWLKKNCPSYRSIVEEKQRELYDEIIKFKSQITGLLIKLPPDICSMTIEELDISARSTNTLKRAGLKTVGDILEFRDLSTIKNMSERSKNEIMSKLWELDNHAELPPAPIDDELDLDIEYEDIVFPEFDEE